MSVNTKTLDPTIEETKAKFLEAKGRLIHAFNMIPDDKVDWAPSPSARTAAQIVGHSACAIKNLTETMKGHPFAPKNTFEAEIHFRKEEEGMHGRQMVMDLLETNSAGYVEFLESLSPEQLDTMIELPFNFGMAPIRAAMPFPGLHTMSHVPQLEYIQTIYGDRDWHLPTETEFK